MTPPVRRITATSSRGLLGVADLWSYRELLYFLIWRDVRVRYTQAVLGVAWAVLQPLTLMILFTIVFGRVMGVPSDGIPYPLFACGALVPWQLFSSSVASSNESVVANERIITRIYFPRVLLPVASVLTALVDFAVALALLVVLMVGFGVAPGPAVVLLPVFAILTIVVAFGAGIWLAALNAEYRDFRYVTPFLLQAWLFATPVVFSSHSLPSSWQAILALNPMTAAVEGFRWTLLRGTPPSLSSVLLSAAIACLLLASGLAYFARLDDRLADIV